MTRICERQYEGQYDTYVSASRELPNGMGMGTTVVYGISVPLESVQWQGQYDTYVSESREPPSQNTRTLKLNISLKLCKRRKKTKQ